MNNKIHGHSIEFLKRQAKRTSKLRGIPHNRALDEVAMSVGAPNWRSLIKSVTTDPTTKTKKEPVLSIPKPSVLAYYPSMMTIKDYRPNRRMSVANHQKLGDILKTLKNATEHHKRASAQLKMVAFQLDEWAQKEYTDRSELTDGVFFDLYYGNNDTVAETNPSHHRKSELKRLCREAEEILKHSYHACKPLKDLLDKLDRAIKWIDAWPKEKPRRVRDDKFVPPGTFIRIKSKKLPAILISHNRFNGLVVCYADSGVQTIPRQNIVVPKDQSEAKEFKPMRLWLPYGRGTYANGDQVLFNRDYIALWTKSSNGEVNNSLSRDKATESQNEFFFNDGSAPWHGNKHSREICIKALKDWNVEHLPTKLLVRLPLAITSGDVSPLLED